jgi:hypothetical protein
MRAVIAEAAGWRNRYSRGTGLGKRACCPVFDLQVEGRLVPAENQPVAKPIWFTGAESPAALKAFTKESNGVLFLSSFGQI